MQSLYESYGIIWEKSKRDVCSFLHTCMKFNPDKEPYEYLQNRWKSLKEMLDSSPESIDIGVSDAIKYYESLCKETLPEDKVKQLKLIQYRSKAEDFQTNFGIVLKARKEAIPEEVYSLLENAVKNEAKRFVAEKAEAMGVAL